MGWFKKVFKEAGKVFKDIGDRVGDVAKDIGDKARDPGGTLKYLGNSFLKDPVGSLMVIGAGPGGSASKAGLNLGDREAPELSALVRTGMIGATTAATGGAFASFLPGIAGAAGSTVGSIAGGVGGQAVGQIVGQAVQTQADALLQGAASNAIDAARGAILGKSASINAPVAFPSDGARRQALQAVIDAGARSPAPAADRLQFANDIRGCMEIPGWYDVAEIRRRLQGLGLQFSDDAPAASAPASTPASATVAGPALSSVPAWAWMAGGVAVAVLVLSLLRRR